MHRRWYWKAYFILMAGLTVSGVGLSIYFWDGTSSLDSVVEWISLPMYVVQPLGLFGFIYWRRIGSPLLWKFVFGASVLEFAWVAYEVTLEAKLYFGGEFAAFMLSFAIMGVVVSLPLLGALYIYAFRSPMLWGEPAVRPG